MSVIFRVDASSSIGLGHLMRCQTLARELYYVGINCKFIINQHDLDLSIVLRHFETKYHLIDSEPAAISELSSEINSALTLVIVDHYQIGADWHHHVKQIGCYVMAIDDLADRCLAVDLLLDQNVVEHYKTRYNRLLPDSCVELLGSTYALLRDDFREVRQDSIKMEQRFEESMILINFGGADPHNETLKALKGIVDIDGIDKIIIVIGAGYLHLESLQAWLGKNSKVTLLSNITNMAHYMNRALVMIGAVGTTTWERCALGCVGLVSSIAENQLAAAQYLHKIGAHHYLGHHSELVSEDYGYGVQYLMNSPDKIRAIANKSSSIVDGLGARRVAHKIQEFLTDKHATR